MALTTSTKHACPSRSPGQTWESFLLVVAKKDSKVRQMSKTPSARLWSGSKCLWVLAQVLLLGHLSKLSNTGTRLKFLAVNVNVWQKKLPPLKQSTHLTEQTRDLPP